MRKYAVELLTPGEAARLLGVNPVTLRIWAKKERIGAVRTPGGHRRYRSVDVEALLRGER